MAAISATLNQSVNPINGLRPRYAPNKLLPGQQVTNGKPTR